MSDHYVEGVGNIPLPDGISDEDAAELIKSNPKVVAYQKQLQNPTIAGKADKALTDVFGPINDYIKNNNVLGMETSKNLSHETVKGIPVLGALTPDDTQENKDFQENHPIASEAAKIAGGVASVAPLAAGVAAATGPGLIANTLTQGGLGATLGYGNAKAHGEDEDQSKKDTLLGLIGGASSPAISKVLSPGTELGDKTAQSLSRLLGAAAGHFGFGNDGILGLLLGEAPLAPSMLQKAVGNKVLQNPNNSALLSAIAQQGGQVSPQNLPFQVPNGN